MTYFGKNFFQSGSISSRIFLKRVVNCISSLHDLDSVIYALFKFANYFNLCEEF